MKARHYGVTTALRALAAVATAAAAASSALAGPAPIGDSIITVSYPTAAGIQSFSGTRDYRGVYFPDATPLAAAPNIKVFSAVDVYGRRARVAISYPEVLAPEESLIAHAFLKLDNSQDFFPGITEGAAVTVEVEGIHFAEPVDLQENTFLFHTLWDTEQSNQLHHYYDHEHNLHTLTDPYRDAHEFHLAHEFVVLPAPHQVFGDIAPYITITGDGTDTLGFTATIPYAMFKHLHEEGQMVPDGLPAPHGFLEPYHFHFEYVVSAVPEPTTLALLLPIALLAIRRLRRTP